MGFKPITNERDLSAALSADVVVLYKHSTRCNVSTNAFQQLEKFQKAHPDTPVYIVDVVADRSVSDHIADRFGIQHKSPQAIIVRRGEAVWDASHFKVTLDAIEKQIEG